MLVYLLQLLEHNMKIGHLHVAYSWSISINFLFKTKTDKIQNMSFIYSSLSNLLSWRYRKQFYEI